MPPCALRLTLVALACAACGTSSSPDAGGDEAMSYFGQPFAAAVKSFLPGPGAGHGAEGFPEVVLGPPAGRGKQAGSVDDVLSLGLGGEIVLELGVDAIDGVGPDLIVFENPFVFAGDRVFSEPGQVAFSLDGETFIDHPCEPDSAPPNGCAGFTPVLPTDDPTDPSLVGGDVFDLAAVGLSRVRFVRVRDAGATLVGEDGAAGFDLDAVAVIHQNERGVP
ncbi:MAG: cell surface protein [Myxococcota bacterium]